MQLRTQEGETFEGEITMNHPAASIDERPVLVIYGKAYGTAEVEFTILKATSGETAMLQKGGYPLRLIPETEPMDRGDKKTETEKVVEVWRILRQAVDILDDPEEAQTRAHEMLQEFSPDDDETSPYVRIFAGRAENIRDRVVIAKWELGDEAIRNWKGHNQDIRDRLKKCRSNTRASISPEEAERIAAEIRSLVSDFGRRMASLLKTEGYLKHYATPLPG